MKLVTFQSLEALKDLINKGYLECKEEYVSLNKMRVVYSWVLEKMNARVKNNTEAKYPIWCWVKCYNSICPPKHKGGTGRGI